MSEATKKALEAALESHMSDEHGMNIMLTGYILQGCGSSAEDDRDLLVYCGKEGQSGIVTQGLLNYIDYNVQGQTFELADGETD